MRGGRGLICCVGGLRVVHGSRWYVVYEGLGLRGETHQCLFHCANVPSLFFHSQPLSRGAMKVRMSLSYMSPSFILSSWLCRHDMTTQAATVNG